MSDFACGGCDYSTAELKDGMNHAATTGHALTRTIDDEGTTMTISLDVDGPEDDDDDWDEED